MDNFEIHDIEIYKNLFLMCTENVHTRERNIFEISPYKDDRVELIAYLQKLKDENIVLVGYNSHNYDGKILTKTLNNMNLKGRDLCALLKKHSDNLIRSAYYNNFANKLHSYYTLDLLKIWHFDNEAKMTSLKSLEFAMKMDNLQELPFEHDAILSEQDIEVVRKYCWNDIEATYQFFLESEDKIKFRKRMGDIYGLDLTNYNDVKIGEMILLKELEKTIPDIKNMRTPRTVMRMKDIVLPIITFNSVEFNTLLTWWKDKVITQTKGQFSELDLDYVKPLLPYCDNTLKKGKLKKLNIVYKGVQFDFGTGGIHGVCGAGIWREDEEYELILVDVSSYYPNLARFFKFHPEHIPVEIFVAMIVTLYNQRMQGKSDGDNEIVSAIKLALNGALYGKSNSKYSFMFDPMFMMKICVNGQLLLVSLAEKLMDSGMELIQINTDGILVRVKKSDRHILDKHCNDWMNLTNLSLDYDHFSLVVQKDVNNYLAVYTNGKVKEKGAAFSTNPEWHKNHSSLVVQKAIKAYFVHGEDPLKFIQKANIYDFFLRGKVQKNHKLLMRGEEDVETQKIVRYIVSNEGVSLIKVMPPLQKNPGEWREEELEAGWKCTVCNDLRGVDLEELRENVNYEYYLQRIYKVINTIENED